MIPSVAVLWHHVHCNAGVRQKKGRDMQPVCVLLVKKVSFRSYSLGELNL